MVPFLGLEYFEKDGKSYPEAYSTTFWGVPEGHIVMIGPLRRGTDGG
jgi:hypothetical protein